MRKISLVLAILMLLCAMLSFAACDSSDGDKVFQKDSDKNKGDKVEAADDDSAVAPEDADLAELVALIEESAPYEEYVNEILYKENDPDEMVCWTYGVIDIAAYDYLSDYVITMPSDYSQTLAILKFEDGMTDDDFAAVKEAITKEYIKTRSSALQMYMPEEYGYVEWALANPDSIWRQYGDNLLVLAIYGEGEPTAVWNVIDSYIAD